MLNTLIDTHSHIYSEEFDADRDEAIQRAKDIGITHIIMPNVDSVSLPRMLHAEASYPGFCFACIGLHPTSVNANFQQELNVIKSELERRLYIAIGEIGLDLYWDKTFLNEQIQCFQTQLQWALNYQLPVIIHIRDAFDETMEAMQPFKNKGLKGVFHSFTGTVAQGIELIEFGEFLLGINGIVTFKNATLSDVLAQIPLEKIVLETDSPYLAPSPHRGKRNESAFLTLIASKLANIYGVQPEKIVSNCSQNSRKTFKII